MTINKAILAMGIAAIMVFAGVAAFADDADAAEGEESIKVTYTYEGNSIVRTASPVDYEFEDFSILAVDAPEGYEFKAWADVGSSAIYTAGGNKYTFTGDVTVEPVFSLEDGFGEIALVYGDITETYVIKGVDDGEGKTFTLSEDDLEDFAELTGLELSVNEDAIVLAAEDAELEGFKNGKADPVLALSGITTGNKTTTTYELIVEPVYAVSFVVDGVTVATSTSTALVAPIIPTKANYTFAGWNDGESTFAPSYNDQGKYVVDFGDYEFVADTTFTAVWAPVVYDVTFINGDVTDVRSAKYGGAIDAPALGDGYLGWALQGDVTEALVEFPYTVLGPVTFVAVEGVPAVVYNVTFEIEGKTPVVLKSDNLVIPSTDREGYEFQGWVVKGTANYVDPMTYDYTSDVTFVAMYKAVTPVEAYKVTFEIEGKSPVTQMSDSLTVPSTDREGYEFQGWVVKGTAAYVDPATYYYTSDVTFVAMYKQIGYSTVTFVIGDAAVEVSVKTGETLAAEQIPELDSAVYSGWDKDVAAVIAEDTVITAVPIVFHTVTFDYGYPGLAAATVTVADGCIIEQLPVIYDYMGAVMWTYDGAPVTADATYTLVAIPVEEEPGFLDTTSGQITAVIAVLVVLFVAALLVVPASPVNYKVLKERIAAKKAAKEADKKP